MRVAELISCDWKQCDTIELYFSEDRGLSAAKRFISKALAQHGRPERIVIYGVETYRITLIQSDTEGFLSQTGKPIAIRSSKYMNNMIEQDHRCIKRRIRSMLDFKSETTAGFTLLGIELIHMMRKQQGVFEYQKARSIKQQFKALAA
ncbi:DDE-type integrase/transposase/recombinase [Brucella pseudogrignonensis]